jgi:hypothetical protein
MMLPESLSQLHEALHPFRHHHLKAIHDFMVCNGLCPSISGSKGSKHIKAIKEPDGCATTNDQATPIRVRSMVRKSGTADEDEGCPSLKRTVGFIDRVYR